MGTIAKVTAGGSTHLVASTAYGTCSTAAATAAKVAVIQDSQDFTLVTGVTVHIKMTNSNTVANATLNVNSTGAKPIYMYGTTAPGTTENSSWKAGEVVSFTYDGTSWMMNDGTEATTVSNLTVTLPVADWTSKAQTVAASGVTANNIVIVAPAPADVEAYSHAGIKCTAQAAGTLSFACDTEPEGDIDVSVLIIKV